jgi:hypothetical protein
MNIKRAKRTRDLKIIGIWIIFMSFFISELFLYTWCRMQNVNIGYEISREKRNRRHFVTLQSKLKIELAHLKSPERIAGIAKGQLGLATPGPEQIITIP